MKNILTLLCLAMSIARIDAWTRPGGVQSLPLGSWTAINAQLEKEICTVLVFMSYDESYSGVFTWYYPSMGSLENVVRTQMISAFALTCNRDHAGASPSYEVSLGYRTDTNSIQGVGLMGKSYPRHVQPNFNPDGSLVLPESELALNWALADYIPVSDALKDVRAVEYLIWDQSKTVVLHTVTANGLIKGCPGLNKTNSLYLSMSAVDPDMLRSSNYTAQVRLRYDAAGRIYDAFDALTGLICDSTVLWLRQIRTNGIRVEIHGYPGKSVGVETSSDLKSWTDRGTLALDSGGLGIYAPVATQGSGPVQPFFVRARL